MSYIAWCDQLYSIHVDAIDEQHKRLLGMINSLHASVQAGAVHDELSPILKELVTYIAGHLVAEEQLMREVSYPEFTRHKALHAEFTGRIAGILQRLKSGQDFSAYELLSFMKNWWDHHIRQEDIKIGRHIQRRTEAAAAQS